jgi:ubiquinone biosynthesis protein UbiJ
MEAVDELRAKLDELTERLAKLEAAERAPLRAVG